MGRAAIYTRVSTNEQANGFGLDVQLEKCLAMAKVKDLEVIHTFTDEGISGALDQDQRPGLASLLAAIENGEVDTVIFAALDRLARKASLLLVLTDGFKDSGIAFLSCRESIDTSTLMGTAMVGLIAVFAELEKNLVVERLTEGRNHRERIDGERGGPLPLGYGRSDDGIVVISNEAMLVKAIFRMRNVDGFVLQKISDVLNDQGHVSKQGGMWYPSTIRQILKTEKKYRGGLRGHSPIFWPVILT